MPFTDDFFGVYEWIKKRFNEKFEFSHAGDVGNQQNILKDIVQPMIQADIVIADLTGLNPNVLYELGVAHSFNKKTIIITKDDLKDLPFDLKSYRTFGYSDHYAKFNNLIEFLERTLSGAVDGSIVFSNPVNDFMPESFRPQVKEVAAQGNQVEHGEEGFLDFLSDIESSMSVFIQELERMTEEVNLLASGIIESCSKIDNATSKNDSKSFAIVKVEVKQMANFILEFGNKLKSHNGSFDELWNKIEKNTLALLENKFLGDGNKEHMKTFISELHAFKESSSENVKAIKDFRQNLKESVGVEKSLNHAIKLLDIDLDDYSNFVYRMCSGIDNIVNRLNT